MKIDFTQPITDPMSGEVVTEGTTASGTPRPLTLASVVCVALNTVADKADDQEKLARGFLIAKIGAAYRNGTSHDLDIEPEEATLARKAILGAWPPVTIGQAHRMLGG